MEHSGHAEDTVSITSLLRGIFWRADHSILATNDFICLAENAEWVWSVCVLASWHHRLGRIHITHAYVTSITLRGIHMVSGTLMVITFQSMLM